MLRAIYPLVFLVSSIVLMGVALFAPLLVGAWILRPLDEAAKSGRQRVQFTVIDFLGLVFLIQLPMALIRLALHSEPIADDTGGSVAIVYAFAWIATGLVWTRSIVVFSRAGVTNAKDRALTVFLVLPMAYMGTFAVPVLLFLAFRPGFPAYSRGLMLGLVFPIAFGVAWSGFVSRQVVKRSASRSGRELRQRATPDDRV